MKYTDKQISRLLDGIFDGSITEYDLPLDYYNAVADYLKKGLYKGFGMDLSSAVGKDLELLTELRENVYMFSAAKTYNEVKEISALLTDGTGVRSFSDFKKEALQLYDTYNVDYLKTEYNTAVGQGTMAVKWNEIEKNKAFLPLLKYSAIGDACDICGPLDGMIEPVDSAIWSSVMPLNHFNCFCTVLQLDDIDNKPTDGNDKLVASVEDKMQPIFVNNVGRTGEVFQNKHPYFEVGKADKEFAQTNFGLPIKETDD